jgi:AAA domain
MDKNLFFVNHGSFENEVEDDTTKNNSFEAKYLINLCNYLRLQGHSSREITILCTYNGQRALLSKLASDMPLLNGVTIVTVDNYQGEENTIVLLSLVRSNDRNRIGFLGNANRVCVALSRAKQGFYMVGNMDFLARNSDLWAKIRDVLERKSALGGTLTLKCEVHRTVIKVSVLSQKLETIIGILFSFSDKFNRGLSTHKS